MKKLYYLMVAALLLFGGLHAVANEITDLDIVDANNTGTAANAGFPEGMPPSDVNNASRALEGMIARWYEDWRGSVISYGSANVIRVTPTRTISAYEDGLTFAFEVTTANTSTVTFNIGTVGPKALVKNHDVVMANGDLESGQKVIVVYNADDDNFQMLTTAASTFVDPMTTRGDSIIRNSSNVTARQAVGAANTVKVSDGTDPSWGSITTANLAAGLDGNLWTWSSSGVATQVTAGLNNQVLTSQGAGTEPRFENNQPGWPTPDFTSSEQSVTVDTVLVVTHGLSAVPSFVSVVLRSVTPELGYALGDEVYTDFIENGSSADRGVTVAVGATSVRMVQGVQLLLIDLTSLNGAGIAPLAWRWVVRAWN